MTSSAPAPWCEPTGPGGSSPWKGGPARWPARRPWRMWACSTGSTPASPRSPPQKCGKPPRDISQPDAVAGVAYLPSDEGSGLTADSLGSAFAVTQLRAASVGPSPRVQPRAPVAARARPEHGVNVTRLPGADLLVSRKTGVPLVTLGIYVPRLRVRPAGAGRARCRCWSVRRCAARASSTPPRSPSRSSAWAARLATSSVSDWLGFGASVLVGAPGRGGHAAGHRFPPPAPARRGHRGRA